MGTNYFAVETPCEHCGRGDRWHICKSFHTFRGYRADPHWPDDPAPTPWGEVLKVDDWRKVLRGERGGPAVTVVDEYGRTFGNEAFIAHLADVPPEARRRQYDWVRGDQNSYRRRDDDWLDPEGFSFHAGEFL